MASMPTCTGMEEAGICPFTNTCCGTLRVEWPLWGSAPVVGTASAFLAFPCSHPNTQRVAASDGGISSPNETSSREHVLA